MGGPPNSPISAVLPEYEISRELGRGAMGVVYLARHRKLGRQVAVKELAGPLANDPEVRSRFLTEARTLAALDHPHIVPIYDYVESGGRCLLIMEALPGGTVWTSFTSTGMTLARSCALILATCSGVQHAHEHGVLHRDLKPENLLFNAAGDLKVADFGIAKVLDGGRTLATIDGSVLGTPAYMAPEQAEGTTVGPGADVYAIGTILYELASGRLPFDGDSPMSLLVQRISKDAPSLRDVAPNVPGPIVDVVSRCLERDPAKRFASAEELGCALGEAAVAALGEDWLGATGVTVSGSRAILVSASATIAPRGARPAIGDLPGAVGGGPTPDTPPTGTPPSGTPTSDAPSTIAPGLAPRDSSDADLTVAPGLVAMASGPADTLTSTVFPSGQSHRTAIPRAVPDPAAATVGVSHGPEAFAATAVVHPAATEHHAGFSDSLQRGDLVDIDDVVRSAAPTALPLRVTVVAGVLAVLVLLFVPVARPSLAGRDSLPDLGINGYAVPAGRIMPVALGNGLVLSGLPAGRSVRARVAYAGIPIATRTAAVSGGSARLDVKNADKVLHGPFTLALTVFDAKDAPIVSRTVALRSSKGPFLSVQGWICAVIALAGLSTAEANSRRHRKGRVINGAVVLSAIAGAIGMVALALVWSMFRPGLAMTSTLAVLFVVSAVAFGSLTVLRARRARQRRLRWKADT